MAARGIIIPGLNREQLEHSSRKSGSLASTPTSNPRRPSHSRRSSTPNVMPSLKHLNNVKLNSPSNNNREAKAESHGEELTSLVVKAQQNRAASAANLLKDLPAKSAAAAQDPRSRAHSRVTKVSQRDRQNALSLLGQVTADSADLARIEHWAKKHASDTDGQGANAAHWACANGLDKAIPVLYKCGVDLNAQTKFGDTPLFYAAFAGSAACVRALLATRTLQLGTQNKRGENALMIACMKDHADVVGMLLDSGADPSVTDKGGVSAVHFCCFYNSTESLEVVLRRPKTTLTDLVCKDAKGRDPLMWCSLRDGGGCAQQLIEFSSPDGQVLDLNGIDAGGDTPLTKAAVMKSRSTLQSLLSVGPDRVDINKRRADGASTLAVAASKNDSLCVSTIMSLAEEKGFELDITLQDKVEGKTALHHAAAHGNASVAAALLQHPDGLKLSVIADKDANLPLHVALAKDRFSVVTLLIKHGAPSQHLLTNRAGKTCADVATPLARQKFSECVTPLFEESKNIMEGAPEPSEIEVARQMLGKAAFWFNKAIVLQSDRMAQTPLAGVLQAGEDKAKDCMCRVGPSGLEVSIVTKRLFGKDEKQEPVMHHWTGDTKVMQRTHDGKKGVVVELKSIRLTLKPPPDLLMHVLTICQRCVSLAEHNREESLMAVERSSLVDLQKAFKKARSAVKKAKRSGSGATPLANAERHLKALQAQVPIEQKRLATLAADMKLRAERLVRNLSESMSCLDIQCHRYILDCHAQELRSFAQWLEGGSAGRERTKNNGDGNPSGDVVEHSEQARAEESEIDRLWNAGLEPEASKEQKERSVGEREVPESKTVSPTSKVAVDASQRQLKEQQEQKENIAEEKQLETERMERDRAERERLEKQTAELTRRLAKAEAAAAEAKRTEEELQQAAAVTKIQAIHRGRKVRKAQEEKRHTRQKQLEKEKLQKEQLRRKLAKAERAEADARKMEEELKQAAAVTKIQAIHRGRQVRKERKQLEDAAVKIQSMARSASTRRLLKGKANVAKQRLNKQEETTKITTQASPEVDPEEEELDRVEAEAEELMRSLEKLKERTNPSRSAVAAHKAVLDQRAMDRAAVVLQSRWKGHVQRQAYQRDKRETDAAIVLQSAVRRLAARRTFLKWISSALVMQRAWRRKHSKRGASHPKQSAKRQPSLLSAPVANPFERRSKLERSPPSSPKTLSPETKTAANLDPFAPRPKMKRSPKVKAVRRLDSKQPSSSVAKTTSDALDDRSGDAQAPHETSANPFAPRPKMNRSPPQKPRVLQSPSAHQAASSPARSSASDEVERKAATASVLSAGKSIAVTSPKQTPAAAPRPNRIEAPPPVSPLSPMGQPRPSLLNTGTVFTGGVGVRSPLAQHRSSALVSPDRDHNNIPLTSAAQAQARMAFAAAHSPAGSAAAAMSPFSPLPPVEQKTSEAIVATCPQCGAVAKGSLEDHELLECSESTVECPLECPSATAKKKPSEADHLMEIVRGVTQVKRKHLFSHMTSECVNRGVLCPMHSCGCDAFVRAKDLVDHCVSYVRAHLKMWVSHHIDLYRTELKSVEDILARADSPSNAPANADSQLTIDSANQEEHKSLAKLFEHAVMCEYKGQYTEAMCCYEVLAHTGHTEALYSYACLLDEGIGSPKDKSMAFASFLKAAQQGHVAAQVCVGACYFNGDGVRVDAQQALYWFKKAVTNYSAQAMYLLGTMYSIGVKDEIEVDETKALAWFVRAALQNHAEAVVEVARHYHRKGEAALAQSLFMAAASRNHPTAQLEVAQILLKDPAAASEGVKWLQRASQLGNYRALAELGICYLRGTGLKRADEKTALYALEWASEKGGDEYATSLLGGVRHMNLASFTEDKQRRLLGFRLPAQDGKSGKVEAVQARLQSMQHGGTLTRKQKEKRKRKKKVRDGTL